jgi:hypothetical protein
MPARELIYAFGGSMRMGGMPPHRSWIFSMPNHAGETTDAGHTVETAVEARAGFLDRPILAVLAISTVVIVAAFTAIHIGFFGS